MGYIPKKLLNPLAKALVAIFYAMVRHSSDAQDNATWEYSHYEIHDVPFENIAVLSLSLKKDTRQDEWKERRKGERRNNIETP